tara:strand:+ start:147 stop:491 length:345 start_codon:yes stop_codon:yes gene_type:complete
MRNKSILKVFKPHNMKTKNYRSTQVTYTIYVTAESGYDFCKKLGASPSISCGQFLGMSKAEIFDGKPARRIVNNHVFIKITDEIEILLNIPSFDNKEQKRWQELWQEDKGILTY